jgi:hypothetical protein
VNAGCGAKSGRRLVPPARFNTGIVVVLWAATRTVRLITRFCFAPTSSSPSIMRTGFAARFVTRSSGTLPVSEISVICTSPPASASSSIRYSHEGSSSAINGVRPSEPNCVNCPKDSDATARLMGAQ